MGFACTSRVLPAPSVTKRPRVGAATVGVSDEASNKLSTTTPSLLRMSTAKLTVALPGTDVAPVARGSGSHGCRMVCVGTRKSEAGDDA